MFSPSRISHSILTTNITTILVDRSFETLTVRLARLALNAFLENVDLIVRVIGEFAEDAAATATSTARDPPVLPLTPA